MERPDIAVRSPDHRLQLVAEVKHGEEASPKWAAQLRRNLLSYGAVPNAPYFLVVVPRHLFLWRNAPPGEIPPDFTASTSDLFRYYLRRNAATPERLGKEGLQLLVTAWLGDLAHAIREPCPDSEPDRLLLDSGAYEAIRRGEIDVAAAA